MRDLMLMHNSISSEIAVSSRVTRRIQEDNSNNTATVYRHFHANMHRRFSVEQIVGI